jgi:hypothetical protein
MFVKIPILTHGLLGFACDFGVTVAMLSPWSLQLPVRLSEAFTPLNILKMPNVQGQ